MKMRKPLRLENYNYYANEYYFITICTENKEKTLCNTVSSFVGTFKRYTNKSIGNNIWQTSFYDHIIRDDADYLRFCEYIENNPAKWEEDKYFFEEKAKPSAFVRRIFYTLLQYYQIRTNR